MSLLRSLSRGQDVATVAPVATELQAQEQRITAGMSAFSEVGDALAKIKDSRLYREKYPGWIAYLGERWNMTTAQADRLMSAAAVVAEIAAAGLAPPAKEYHARQLTGVPQGQRAAVWQEAQATVADGEPITAEQVDKVASKYRKQKRGRFRKPKTIVLSGKGWRLELSRKTSQVDVAAALESALAQWQSKSRAA